MSISRFFIIFFKFVNMIFKLLKTMRSLLIGSQRRCSVINIYCRLDSSPYIAALHQYILTCNWLKQPDVLTFIAKLDVKIVLNFPATN
jgi:hypothetical protein